MAAVVSRTLLRVWATPRPRRAAAFSTAADGRVAAHPRRRPLDGIRVLEVGQVSPLQLDLALSACLAEADLTPS